MLEILQKIHAGTETGCRAGSKTIRKVGSGSEKIISDPQHCLLSSVVRLWHEISPAVHPDFFLYLDSQITLVLSFLIETFSFRQNLVGNNLWC
jgi:hypothetical protein